MPWSELPFGLGPLAAQVDDILDLSSRSVRLECISSTRALPALRMELTGPVDAKRWDDLMKAVAVPAPGALVLRALTQQVGRDREVVTVGADGSLAFAFTAPLDVEQISTVVAALGCDRESPALDALAALNGTLNGFSCKVFPGGTVAVTAHCCAGHSGERASRAWVALARTVGVPPSCAELVALLHHARAADPSATFHIELVGPERPAIAFEVPDVPAQGIEAVLHGHASPDFLSEARDALRVREQHSYRAVVFRRPARRQVEVCIRIDVGNERRLLLPGGQERVGAFNAVRIVLPQADANPPNFSGYNAAKSLI